MNDTGPSSGDDPPPGEAPPAAASIAFRPAADAAPPADIAATLPAAPPPAERYPVRFDVAYPERLSRWKTFLRLPLLVPVLLFAYLMQWALAVLFLVGWTTVFWRKTYPSWALAGLAGALGFTARYSAYGLLLTDNYPSFDQDKSPVTLNFDEPSIHGLSRWRVFFWKLLLLVPHLIVLSFLNLAAAVVTILAWFGILLSGHYPRGMFAFVVGVQRWHFRVSAYFASFNDRFPPYALSAEAGPAGRGTVIASGIVGAAASGVVVALFTVAVIITSRTHRETVSYAELQRGQAPVSVFFDTAGGRVVLTLGRVYDPGESRVPLLRPAAGERVVLFEWVIRNESSSGKAVAGTPAILTVRAGAATHQYTPRFTIVEGTLTPAIAGAHTTTTVDSVFVVPIGAIPTQLQFHNGFLTRGGVTYSFE